MSRPLRIGLLGEGPAELGNSLPRIKSREGGKVIEFSKEGALHTLIRRELAKIGYECEFIQRHPVRKEFLTGMVRTGYLAITKPEYIERVVSAWYQDEVDLIILVVDADQEPENRRRLLNDSLEKVRDNHFLNDKLCPDNNVGGLAIQSFDTWILADTQQIENCLSIELPQNLPQNLEELSGDSRLPNCSKNIFDKAVEDSSRILTNPTITNRNLIARWELAFNVDLDQIKQRCPNGYKPFAISLCQVAQTILQTRSSEK